jgi:mono/diheme cytochrome c family protein
MKLILKIVIAAAILAVLGLAFIYSGIYNVAANVPHTPLVHWILETTMERSVDVRGEDIEVPDLTDSHMVSEGYEHYQSMCLLCHAAPGIDYSEIAQGLNPQPPRLAESAREMEPGELFWVTRNGVKMTGMPAFGKTHSDEKIWNIVALLVKLPDMSPEEYLNAGQVRAEGNKEQEKHEAGEGHEHSDE